MRRPLLLAAAAVFFAYIQYSGYLWLRDHGPIGNALQHAWETIMRDPIVLMAWNDMAVFTALVLTWFWRELKSNGRSMLWWWATLLGGCPPLLVYLAFNEPRLATRAASRQD